MFKTPILTVDAIILTLIDGKLKVALMKRPEGPFEGCLALPGGYVHADPQAGYVDSSADAAMRRILLQKAQFQAQPPRAGLHRNWPNSRSARLVSKRRTPRASPP